MPLELKKTLVYRMTDKYSFLSTTWKIKVNFKNQLKTFKYEPLRAGIKKYFIFHVKETV